jgi:lipopolysaccharide export system permease protein
VGLNDEIVSRVGYRLGPSLGRYVARHLALPTVVALLGLGVAFLTRSLLAWSDLLLNRGLGASAVGVLAVHQLVPVFAQVLPFAMLIGILAGLGHLRSTGELLAVEVCGVSPRRLVGPVTAFAGAVTIVALLLALWLAPASRAKSARAVQAMLAAQPGATLTAGVVHEFGEHRLTAREVSSRGDELRGVVLWSPEVGETLFAERASVAPVPAGQGDEQGAGGIALVMHGATALLGPSEGGGQIEVGTFRAVLSPGDAGLGDAEDQLAAAPPAALRRLSGGDGANARLARAELHRRLALPLAGLILGLSAVPLALLGGRSSRASGAVLGLLLTVAYYGLTQLGSALLRDPRVPVEAAVWLPDLVFGALAVALLSGKRSAGVPAGPGTPQARRRRAPAVRWIPAGRFILPRYVAVAFLEAAGLCFAALLVGYLLVDVLERMEWFARHGAGPLEALRFYAARTPLLMSRVGPLALLAAASLTISQLERRGELVAMQACGLSRVRALLPISAVAALAVPVYFVVTDSVVPRTNALADQLKETEIKGGASAEPASRFIWYRVGGNLLQASRMNRGHSVASDVTIYELDERGFPRSRIDAEQARDLGGGNWELLSPRRVEISGSGVHASQAATRVHLGGALTELDSMHLGVRALNDEIRRARADGYDATALEVELQARLAAPFACLLLPLAAILSALSRRSGGSAARSLMLATVLAVGFTLLDDVSLSLGYGARLPPVAAAWAPTSLLALLCLGVAWRAPR